MRRPGRDRGVLIALAVVAVILAFALGLAFGNAAAQTACQTGPRDPAGVYVNLADDLNAQAIGHVRDAVARGKPRVLHWEPGSATAHRDASLRGFPIWSRLSAEARRAIDPDHPDVTHDRDEYPPAASAEGGAGADVRYILFSDNRSAGSRMQAQMGAYCAETRFVIEP
jgi:hypothetical protein